MGCISQVGEQAGDIARVASLIAGLPLEVSGVIIDRQCGSSQQAVNFATQARNGMANATIIERLKLSMLTLF